MSWNDDKYSVAKTALMVTGIVAIYAISAYSQKVISRNRQELLKKQQDQFNRALANNQKVLRAQILDYAKAHDWSEMESQAVISAFHEGLFNWSQTITRPSVPFITADDLEDVLDYASRGDKSGMMRRVRRAFSH